MNGIVIIDKAPGMTSHDVVQEVKRALGLRKAGHVGTLDPLATGVLPVCLNEATKLASFLGDGPKEYRATMLLGVRTDTQDTEGLVMTTETPDVSREAIEEALQDLTGFIEQIPPKYSAIKFKGKPLHRWARQGVDIDPPARTVEIRRIDLEEVALPYVTFTVACSKGTYIRTLCADIGERVGCGACLAALRRTRNGAFHEGLAVSLSGLNPAERRDVLVARVIPMGEAIGHVPAVVVDAEGAALLRTGRQPDAAACRDLDMPFLKAGDMVRFVLIGGELVAVARTLQGSEQGPFLGQQGQMFKLMRVFLGEP